MNNLFLLIQVFTLFLPWVIRRRIFMMWGHRIDGESYIGFSIIKCSHIKMAAHSRIGHLNYFKNLEFIDLGDFSSIGNINWFSSIPRNGINFSIEDSRRRPGLVLGCHSAITNRHYFDCQDLIQIGDYSTFAGVRSQVFAHSIDIKKGRQACAPVLIGAYTIVGTGSVILPGAVLPDFSVLSAGSVLRKGLSKHSPQGIYSGNPAKFERATDSSIGYFIRNIGEVR